MRRQLLFSFFCDFSCKMNFSDVNTMTYKIGNRRTRYPEIGYTRHGCMQYRRVRDTSFVRFMVYMQGMSRFLPTHVPLDDCLPDSRVDAYDPFDMK
jgi:hypothetical protein